uniref:hypothetical protein n=1 Tax=Cryobacterium sp. TaxID=1926290 RepID=UPI0015EE4C94|nr:hypothetical protein [Cryobacterium sp.]
MDSSKTRFAPTTFSASILANRLTQAFLTVAAFIAFTGTAMLGAGLANGTLDRLYVPGGAVLIAGVLLLALAGYLRRLHIRAVARAR